MTTKINLVMNEEEEKVFQSFLTTWDDICHKTDGDCSMCPFNATEAGARDCTDLREYFSTLIKRFKKER